jgi:iron(III) transport system substrate-binding protein
MLYKTNISLPVVVMLLIAVLFFSCSREEEVVNVYSGRHYQADENLYKEFTSQTGIRVNLIKANTDQLINRLELEGSNSPADLFITADAGRMIQVKQKNLLQPMNVERISQIVPSHLRDGENFWTGFTLRARVIVYDRERVNPGSLNTYESLTDPEWQGKVLVRSSQNDYNQTLMASIIAHHGEERARQWARNLVANMAQEPTGNDRDQVKAIAAGVGDVAIVNTYYMGLMLTSTNSEEQNVARRMGIFFPNQNDRGAHINISGIAITAHAPNKENAQRLIEFLLDNDAQRVFAEENFEYPVNPQVEWTNQLNEWGRFHADTLPLDQLGQHLSRAAILFNEAGWK